jgi:hypothetical protein
MATDTKLDLLVLLSAIGSAEGYFTTGTVPNSSNNPGDLRFAGQEGSKPSIHGGPIPFAQFDCPERGIVAGLRQICAMTQRGLSLRQLIYAWAPPTGPDGGNPSELYLTETIRRISQASGVTIDPERKLWEYLPISHIP